MEATIVCIPSHIFVSYLDFSRGYRWHFATRDSLSPCAAFINDFDIVAICLVFFFIRLLSFRSDKMDTFKELSHMVSSKLTGLLLPAAQRFESTNGHICRVNFCTIFWRAFWEDEAILHHDWKQFNWKFSSNIDYLTNILRNIVQLKIIWDFKAV